MCYCYNELSGKTDFIMVSQSPYKVHTKPRKNGLATGWSFVMQDKKEVVDVYNKEKTMMAAVN